MKALLCITLIFCCEVVVFARTETEYSDLFSQFVQNYNKQYSSQEEHVQKFQIFRNNVDWIEQFNTATPKRSFTVGINSLADLTHDEYKSLLRSYKQNLPSSDVIKAQKQSLPSQMDWRSKGVVSAVEDQGQCGDAEAFVTADAVASCVAIATGKLPSSLSRQQLVDCVSFGQSIIEYLIENGGMDSLSCYPDDNCEPGQCNYQASCCAAKVGSMYNVTSGDESSLQQAVFYGPTVAGIDASLQSFQFYNGGVYYDPACSADNIDHEVLVVGWGNQAGTDFWQVKNSWGAEWGMDGYIEMARNRNNNCGIASFAAVPLKCTKC